jgi:pimeloyl-ACP methyl ester carboxylesterase
MQQEFSVDGLINQVNTDLEAKNTTEHLHKIQSDLLLVHGKQDQFYEEEMWVLKNNIANSEIIEVEHCGHMLPLEKPEILSVIIQNWL